MDLTAGKHLVCYFVYQLDRHSSTVHMYMHRGILRQEHGARRRQVSEHIFAHLINRNK